MKFTPTVKKGDQILSPSKVVIDRPLALPKLADPTFLPFIAETAEPTQTDLQNQMSFGSPILPNWDLALQNFEELC